MKIILGIFKYLLIFGLPAFFYLNPFLPWPKDLIFEAAGHGNGILAFFDAQKNGNPAPFFWGHTSYVLGQVFLMIVYKIFGVSTFTTILNTSLLAFFTIIISYFLARKIIGELGAILFLILFSGSLYFLMIIKTAYPFYGTIPLTVSFTFFTFILAHQNHNKLLLYLSGIGLAFVGISGGQPAPLSLFILGLFLIWKLLLREKTFRFKNYFLFTLVTIGIFCLFHVLFPLINNNKPFDYLLDSYRLLSERGGQVALKGDYNFRRENANRMIKALFFDMGIPGQGHQQNLAGRAMIPFPISLFFLIGIITAFFRKTNFDRLLLIWIAITFLFYSFFADFQVRYFVFVGSAIYGLAAIGMLSVLKKFKNHILFVVIIIAVLMHYLYTTYTDYYVVMAGKAFKMELYEGQAEMASFIKKNYQPKNTFLVFGNVKNIFPQNFVFYTWDSPYQFIHWHYFTEGSVYTPVEAGIIQGKPNNPAEDPSLRKFREWEIEKLISYPKIIYALGYYNEDYTLTEEMLTFRRLHPNIEPVKIIYASTKFPHIAIYEIDREESETKENNVNLDPLMPFNFFSDVDNNLKSLLISGATSGNSFYLNQKQLSIPYISYPDTTLLLNFGNNNHHLSFSPVIDENIIKNVFQSKNILFVPEGNLISGKPDSDGEIVFKIEAPGKISRLNILFFPRIFNDKERESNLSLDYSLDNNKYKNIYSLQSDGTGGWIGLWERRERLIIFPQAKTIYLKFKLTGTAAQILSGPKSAMTFEADFNWNSLLPEVIQGQNSFYFVGPSPLSVSLFY